MVLYSPVDLIKLGGSLTHQSFNREGCNLFRDLEHSTDTFYLCYFVYSLSFFYFVSYR